MLEQCEYGPVGNWSSIDLIFDLACDIRYTQWVIERNEKPPDPNRGASPGR